MREGVSEWEMAAAMDKGRNTHKDKEKRKRFTKKDRQAANE